MKKLNRTHRFFFLLFGFGVLFSSQNLIDGVAAVVGQHVILKSEVAVGVQMTAVERRRDPRFDIEKLEQ